MVLADTTLRKTKMARMSNADLDDIGGKNADLGFSGHSLRHSPL